MIKPLELALKIKEALSAKKGIDIVILDVIGISSVTDYYVIVTGNSKPHLKALTDDLHKEMKAIGVPCLGRSGTPDSEWLLADYIDVIVHIFSPDTREYYGLEQLWNDAKRVED